MARKWVPSTCGREVTLGPEDLDIAGGVRVINALSQIPRNCCLNDRRSKQCLKMHWRFHVGDMRYCGEATAARRRVSLTE